MVAAYLRMSTGGRGVRVERPSNTRMAEKNSAEGERREEEEDDDDEEEADVDDDDDDDDDDEGDGDAVLCN